MNLYFPESAMIFIPAFLLLMWPVNKFIIAPFFSKIDNKSKTTKIVTLSIFCLIIAMFVTFSVLFGILDIDGNGTGISNFK